MSANIYIYTHTHSYIHKKERKKAEHQRIDAFEL